MHRYNKKPGNPKRAKASRRAPELSNQRKRKRLFTGLLLLIVIAGLFIQNRIFTANGSNTDSNVTGSSIPDRQKNQDTSATSNAVQKAPDTASWNLQLVNFKYSIPEDYTVETTPLLNGQAVDSRIYPALQDMMDAARAKGLSPLICSSYRTSDKQTSLYDAQIQTWLNKGYSEEDAEKQAAMWVAPSGKSEHQLGLAVDIVAASYQLLDEAQENTPEQKWLMKHCAEYGFILRYPADKCSITGVGYEPWHYRYVGKEAAAEIMEEGLCLEEYLAY